VVNQKNGEIVHCVVEMQGAKSDLRILKESKIQFGKKVCLKADLGYQGLSKVHFKSKIPFKRPRNSTLNEQEKAYNQKLRAKRVRVEHAIRRCKVFRIVKECFRNKQRKLQMIWSVVCGIVNFKNKNKGDLKLFIVF
jgi:hypothetical protein